MLQTAVTAYRQTGKDGLHQYHVLLHHREVYQTNCLRHDFAIFYFNKLFDNRKVIFNCCHNIKPEIQDAFHPSYLLPEVARGAYFPWKGHIFAMKYFSE